MKRRGLISVLVGWLMLIMASGICGNGTVYDKSGTLCGVFNAPMTPLDNGMMRCD